MQKTDRDDRTIAENALLNIGIPSSNIDLRRVLISLREDLLIRRLRFANNFTINATNVIVPSLKSPFDLWYENGDILLKTFHTKKKYRVPCEFESDMISEKTIEIIYRLLEHLEINQP
jgi:hypothetical protein